jgi:YVTN family beta-propeller protein
MNDSNRRTASRLVARLVLALTALLAMRPVVAQGPQATLWVTLGDSDLLVEIDAYTFQERRRITVDPRPHGLAASADGATIYIGSDRTGNFQVIDARSGRITAQIPLGKDPNQLTLTKDGRFAYMPMRAEDTVAVIELSPLRVVKKIPMNRGPHDAYTSADGSRIFVGAQYGNSIAVFDPASHTLLHHISTADGVRPLEPTADGRILYAALSNLLGFVVVDPVSRSVTRRIELGQLPEGVPKPYLDTYTHAIQLVKNDSELWITDCINDLVRVVRTSDFTEVAQIRVGKFPHWFTLRPDGQVLFVSLWDSHAVAAIDVNTRKVLTNIQFPRGSGPKRILATVTATGTRH